MAQLNGMACVLASFLAIGAAVASPPPDGIDLRANPGPNLNDVTLSWTGGTSTFSVYAAFAPASLIQPVNLQAVIASSPFIDIAAIVSPGTVLFYRVVATPAVCGNGSLEGIEGCDDGNAAPGDGCSAACAVETGFVCSFTPSVCEPICGDGLVVAGETCDDANVVNGDGCSNTCTVEPGFNCVGQPSVCAGVCGDGIRAGAEQCDDANSNSGDGCSFACAVEPGFTCVGSPSICTTTCGDGVRAGAEACDDANVVNGDGCSNTCTVEPGFNCFGQPSVCVGVCGDGIRVGAEQCDDANATNGDGCSSSCNVEVGFSCAGQPSVCTAICGDGLQRGTEQCDDGNVTSGDGCSSTCTIEAACSLLRVNELVTATTASANDEFIEVFNPCYVPVNLGGWKLVYRSAAGATDAVLISWTATTIQPRSYLLYVGNAYVGTNDGVYSAATMSATGGGVAVRNSVGVIVDSVGYGTATNIFVEGTAVGAPPVVAPPGRSIGRFPNGVDTNQNSADFHLTNSVTPRAANN